MKIRQYQWLGNLNKTVSLAAEKLPGKNDQVMALAELAPAHRLKKMVSIQTEQQRNRE